MSEKNIYPFKAKMLNGLEKHLSDFKSKVLLIVNTASSCVFTSQFKELQELYEEYKGKDFEILAFPSNDFGKQEALNGKEIETFCTLNFGVKFMLFDKILVRGKAAHPLYQFLTNKSLNGNINSTPRWNFHKFLINRKGEVVDYFYPLTKPSSAKIKKKIQRLLNEK